MGLVALLFCGCDTTDSATRRELAAQREAEQARLRAVLLDRVHVAEGAVWERLHPMLTAAADYKEEETHAYTGAVFVTEDFYSEALEKEARAEGFGSYVSVLTVFPDSPAERAGLRSGDRLLELNGTRVPQGSGAAVYAARKLKRQLVAGEENQLLVQRGDEILELTVTPDKGAYYGVVIVASNSVSLQVDGDVIWIGLDTVESLKGGDELTYLCAYALAKNVMRHTKQKGKNMMLGQILDMAAAAGGVSTGGLFGGMGANAYSQAFEVEADLIAIYLLASSGNPYEGYPAFWDKALKARSRKGGLSAKDMERIAVAGKVVASIAEKEANGEPIFPEAYLQGDVSEIELGDAGDAEK